MKRILLSPIADQDNVREWTKLKRKDKQWNFWGEKFLASEDIYLSSKVMTTFYYD